MAPDFPHGPRLSPGAPHASSPDSSTIFIVDDDPSARKGLLLLVRSAGWHGEAFASAEDFLARPAYSGTGCVILDVRMPGMSGLQLRDQMAKRGLSLPIVFLTGHGDVPMGVDAIKKGAVDFLQKPVDDQALLRAVEDAIRQHAAVQTARRERERLEARARALTPRERDVLECLLAGRLNKQIAADLGIAEATVKQHRGVVMHKMEAASVPDLVRLCELAGIAPRTTDSGARPTGA